jgi:hypothetical protein
LPDLPDRPGISHRPDLSSRPGASHASPAASPFFGSRAPARFGARSTSPTLRSGSITRQRAVEQRNLDHRRATADHLRSVGERNGNAQLDETADRMEERADEHYHRRIDRLDQRSGEADGSSEPTDSPAATDVPPPEATVALPGAERPSVRERLRRFFSLGRRRQQPATAAAPPQPNPPSQSVFERRRSIEQAKLDHRTHVAEHLRQVSQRNGNERLSQTADRMETRAQEQYGRRIQRIDELEQRIGERREGVDDAPEMTPPEAPSDQDPPSDSTTGSEPADMTLPDPPPGSTENP